MHLLQTGSMKVLTTLLLWIQNSGQLSLLKLSCWLRPCFLWRSDTYQHCVFLFGILHLVYLHCSIWSILPILCQCSAPALPSLLNLLPSIHLLRISCLCTLPTPTCFWLISYTSYFLFLLLTRPGFFNEMPEVFEPEALNSYTLSRLILWILLASRNPSLTIFLFPDPWIPCSAILLHSVLVWYSFSR